MVNLSTLTTLEVAEAERLFAEAEEFTRRSEEDAHARAAEILAGARMQEERIAREAEQVVRGHREQCDFMQTQMDNVRNSLTALTGSAPGE